MAHQPPPRRAERAVSMKVHPLIRKEVGQVDMRCVQPLTVREGIITDLIVRNTPGRHSAPPPTHS